MKNIKIYIQVVVIAILITAQNAVAQTLEALLKAVQENNLPEVTFYLDRGLDPNSTDQQGNTLLMLASRMGYSDLVSMLLARKANVHRRSPAGDTALMIASLAGRVEIARKLIVAGAPLEGRGWTPLHYAAFGGSEPMVRFLLDEGANKNAQAPNGYTPVMLAIRNGHAEALRTLLLGDPDLTVQGQNGETALSLARQRGDQAILELLRRAGVSG